MTRDGRRRAQRRGLRGETLAVWYLRLKGYRILARRLRSAVGEIDVVAARGRTVAVIEVKARPDAATAAEAANPRQRARIARAARLFLAGRPEFAGHAVRFDLMLVSPGRWPRHVPDAWRARGEAGE